MKEYFEFLRPSWLKIITVIVLALCGIVVWAAVIPMIGACSNCNAECVSILTNRYCTNESGANLAMIANIIIGVAIVLILYILVSLLVYLIKGDYKKKENDK